jgi:hypothetical protein
MAFDPSIFGNIGRGVRSVADYDLDRQQVENARQTNALNALRIQGGQREADAYDRNLQRQNALLGILSGGGDANALRKGGFLKEALEWEESQGKQFKDRAAAGKDTADTVSKTIANYRTALDGIADPGSAARWIQAQYQDPTLSPVLGRFGTVDQAIAQIPQDPQAFQQWRQQQALGMEKYLEEQRLLAGQAETVRHNQTAEKQAATRDAETARNNRAQNTVAQERLKLDREAPKGLLDPERGLVVDPRTGEARPVTMGGAPVGAKKPTEAQQKVNDAAEVVTLLDEASKVIDGATGSYLGAAMDEGMRAFGKSTAGAEAAARLKVIQGLLISKQPKMSGPQSDKDVQLYREMAGQIGDSTLSVGTRKAAMDMIRQINERYAGGKPAGNQSPIKFLGFE